MHTVVIFLLLVLDVCFIYNLFILTLLMVNVKSLYLLILNKIQSFKDMMLKRFCLLQFNPLSISILLIA